MLVAAGIFGAKHDWTPPPAPPQSPTNVAAPLFAPSPARCEDKAVRFNAPVGSLICGDQNLLALNKTDQKLHEERIRIEGEARRAKIESDRSALEGLMSTCGAFGPARECVSRMLRNDIAQLQGIIAQDKHPAVERPPVIQAVRPPFASNLAVAPVPPGVQRRPEGPRSPVVCQLPSGQSINTFRAWCARHGGVSY